jgi:hypothetical protein
VGAFVIALILVGPVIDAAGAPPDTEEKAPPDSTSAAATAQSVLAPLQRTLAWYEGARVAMQSIDGVLDADFTRSAQQTAQRVLQRAFDTARARAALMDRPDQDESSNAPTRQTRATRVAKLQAAIAREERGIAELRARLSTATATARPSLERQLTAAANRFDLARTRLDFLTKLGQADAAVDNEVDLADQIRALQDAVPELSTTTAPTTVVTTASQPPVWSSGTQALIYRLLALQRNRRASTELGRTTSELTRATRAELHDSRQVVRPMMARLETLAASPPADGATPTADQGEFRDLLERSKLSGTVVLSLREQSALLQRYASDVRVWTLALDREIGHVLRGLALELLGVGLALAAILAGSVLWRIAVVRYVASDYQRRLLLTARHIVVVIAVALVLVFHFASELTVLVAALGFAAAGIAFALQNVILAVAGYFSMMAPNGIRVGDRVSLQGPFGYVHGEVIEIGVVRTRLRELAGTPLEATGGTLVFPNSVAFTGSFIKHPASENRRP